MAVMWSDTCFNSIKVRLNQSLLKQRQQSYRFQFHKGTIKPGGQCGIEDFVECFNSIKVRLNLCLAASRLFDSSCFNSIKVRLNHWSASGARS